MEGIGSKLRAVRVAWKLTLREVAKRSHDLSQEWQNPAYRISASWLDRIENENRGLSATKLIVLAHIYSLTPEKMLALCPPTGAAGGSADDFFIPNGTLLLQGSLEAQAKALLPDELVTSTPPESTTLLSDPQGAPPRQFVRGIIGRQDRTLEPMIAAGSIVLIDTQKTTIANRRDWNHEFDRPIYFLVTRTDYVAGFCELDKDAEWLTLVPHALSFEQNRRWRYRKDIEVVGTVTATFSRRMA